MKWPLKVIVVAFVLAAGLVGFSIFSLYFEHRPPEGGASILTCLTNEPVVSFAVKDSSDITLWKIETKQPRRLDAIHYREIPNGYVQIVPAGGSAPRLFRRDEALRTLTLSPSSHCTHSGVALSETKFLGGGWEAGPR